MTRDVISTQEAWNFALALYAEGSVATHLLSLQDAYDCNVNVLLLLQYLAHKKLNIDAQCLNQLSLAIADSQEELKAHRVMRREAKADSPRVYQQLKDQEIELERIQHSLLLDRINKWTTERLLNGVTSETHSGNETNMLEIYLTGYSVPKKVIEQTITTLQQAYISMRGSIE
ncbi:TIGR02444 family protein [Alteromonas facilis]|uniref:TIGR02444 family protein n=1 Tax=Alteromonas facilis TaxID=2048004 RepID=UPI000C28FB2C|nr:TIGR02444 family protein [Alteromonas facilis]